MSIKKLNFYTDIFFKNSYFQNYDLRYFKRELL